MFDTHAITITITTMFCRDESKIVEVATQFQINKATYGNQSRFKTCWQLPASVIFK